MLMKNLCAPRGMPFILTTALLLVLCCASAHGSGTTVSYYGRLQLHPQFFQHSDSSDPLWRVQGGEVLLSSAEVQLRVPTQTDGSFVAYDLPYGTYHVHCEYGHFVYPTVRIDITEKTIKAGSMPVIRTYTNDGTMTPVQGTGLDAESPAVIPLAATHVYYTPREEYSIVDILKNPMILIMLISMGMLGLMKMIPEEERKESAKELQNLRKQWNGKPSQDTRRAQLPAGRETQGQAGECA